MKDLEKIVNRIVKCEKMRDKYSQGINYNQRLLMKYYFKGQDLQREYYNIQMSLGLISE